MKEAREVFEALSISKKMEWNGKRYVNANVQTRWKYFLLGWTIRGGK